MLSFAVGGLLGDVFLHILPEAWDLFTKDQNFKNDSTYSVLGYWVLIGNATFILIQMIFTMSEEKVGLNSLMNIIRDMFHKDHNKVLIELKRFQIN